MPSTYKKSKDTPIPKMTEVGFSKVRPTKVVTLNADSILSPGARPSSSSFPCTSFEDDVKVCKFGKDNDYEAWGWQGSQEPPKITLISKDLLQKVSRNASTLASILLEPQNKPLLKNFLEDFNGKGRPVVPWAIAAALKHWGAKLSEKQCQGNGQEAVSSLPHLNTAQTLTTKGAVNDPKALEHLETVAKSYFDKLNRSLIRQAKIVEPEPEPEPAVKPSVSAVAEKESDSKILHRLAGFDSFARIPSCAISQTNLAISSTSLSGLSQKSQDTITVFFKPSAMLAAGFGNISKHLVSADSKGQLSSPVSVTILKAAPSRLGVPEGDDNGNVRDKITDEDANRDSNEDGPKVENVSELEPITKGLDEEKTQDVEENRLFNALVVNDPVVPSSETNKLKRVGLVNSPNKVSHSKTAATMSPAVAITPKLLQPKPRPAWKGGPLTAKAGQVSIGRPPWNSGKPQPFLANTYTAFVHKRSVGRKLSTVKVVKEGGRMQFTKIPVSRRQFDQENQNGLKLNKSNTAEAQSSAPGTPAPTSVVGADDYANTTSETREDVPVPAPMKISADLEPQQIDVKAVEKKPRGRSVVPSGKPSHRLMPGIPSITKVKHVVTFKRKAALGYAALNKQKKNLENAKRSIVTNGIAQATSAKGEGSIQI